MAKVEATPLESDASDPRVQVVEDVKGLGEEAKAYTADDLKSGGWFAKLLRSALDVYSKQVNWEYFVQKYPGLPSDIIASRRIELAQRYAMIEGGLSASAYNGAIAATIGTHGGASPLTLPAGVSSFVIDLLYTTRLQLRLAFDLAVIYKRPIDINDAEDLYDLLRVAFGIKAGEVLRGGLPRLAPEAVRVGIKAVIKGQTLAFLRQLPVIGRYLLQRNLIKFGIPAVGIPLSMKLNHSCTGVVGRQARRIFRDKSRIEQRAATAALALHGHAWLLLRVAYLVGFSDGDFSAEETWFIRHLLQQLEQASGESGLSDRFAGIVEVDVDLVLVEAASLASAIQINLYTAACQIAVSDHDLNRKKLTFLRRLSAACNQPLDEAGLHRAAKDE